MHGPNILVRTLSASTRRDRGGRSWQYHSRSDHHSKVACWGVLFDLMLATPLLKRHVEEGAVGFGINHEMRDFTHDRKKNLDLVLCRPNGAFQPETFADICLKYEISLTHEERSLLNGLPNLRRAPVGAVFVALEAKACMTAHQRALPRLYDELNSSHSTVHGASDHAIAVGFAMVNVADRYLSPDLNKSASTAGLQWSSHSQPRAAQITIDKIKQLPRRSAIGQPGYDALSIILIDMKNDGSAVNLVTNTPAPARGDIYEYDSMIHRLSALYSARFAQIS